MTGHEKDNVSDRTKVEYQGYVIATSRKSSVRGGANGHLKASRQNGSTDDNIIGLSLAKKSPKKNGINQIRAGTKSVVREARMSTNS